MTVGCIELLCLNSLRSLRRRNICGGVKCGSRTKGESWFLVQHLRNGVVGKQEPYIFCETVYDLYTQNFKI
jgi:hypothetical protein